jgi:carbon-monoxide dehydrogenase medium subunit
VRPATLDEALAALAEPDAVALAGGTDLVTLRATGGLHATLLVDVKRLPSLRALETGSGVATVGALVTMRRLETLVEPALGALRDGAALVGAIQTRNRATIGGNVCRSSPAGDTLAPLLTLDTVATVASGGGDRQVPLEGFFLGPGRNALQPGELLTSLRVASTGGSAYLRATVRGAMDLAIVGVAARIVVAGDICTAARVALAGAAPTPILAQAAAARLEGTCLDNKSLADAATLAATAASPIDDVRGSAAYRRRAITALVPRVVRAALRRATGDVL